MKTENGIKNDAQRSRTRLLLTISAPVFPSKILMTPATFANQIFKASL